MKKDKRGISPLIATVLIIGFTIAIAALVFVFFKEQIDLTAKKGENKFNANEEAGVQFEVLSCVSINNKLDLTLSNTGQMRIDCFWVAPKGQTTQLTAFNLKPAQQELLSLKMSNTVDDVEIFPCLIQKNKIKTGKSSVKVTCE